MDMHQNHWILEAIKSETPETLILWNDFFFWFYLSSSSFPPQCIILNIYAFTYITGNMYFTVSFCLACNLHLLLRARFSLILSFICACMHKDSGKVIVTWNLVGEMGEFLSLYGLGLVKACASKNPSPPLPVYIYRCFCLVCDTRMLEPWVSFCLWVFDCTGLSFGWFK